MKYSLIILMAVLTVLLGGCTLHFKATDLEFEGKRAQVLRLEELNINPFRRQYNGFNPIR